MSKKPATYHKILLPLYMTHFILVLADTFEEADDLCLQVNPHHYRHYEWPMEDEGVAALVYNDPGGLCLIYLPHKGLDRNMIAHEIGHLASGILRHKGMKLSPESEEAYTYLQGYLTDVVNHILDAKKIKVRSVSSTYEEFIATYNQIELTIHEEPVSTKQADSQGEELTTSRSGDDQQSVLEGREEESGVLRQPDHKPAPRRKSNPKLDKDKKVHPTSDKALTGDTHLQPVKSVSKGLTHGRKSRIA